VDRLAGPSIDSFKALVFGVYLSCLTKIVFSITNDTCLHAVQLAISINLESVFFLLWIVFLAIKVVNKSVMSSLVRVKS
jgi:succinate-acetate transporter protein